MTNLEITKLCAEAMGLKLQPANPWNKKDLFIVERGSPAYPTQYDPLTNDAQALALVKKFCLQINWKGVWPAVGSWEPVHGPDLNRAICECVAKMQQTKSK